MTGPEHYKIAEQCIADANAGVNLGDAERQWLLTEANAHATLALAAAIAFSVVDNDRRDIDDAIADTWADAVGLDA